MSNRNIALHGLAANPCKIVSAYLAECEVDLDHQDEQHENLPPGPLAGMLDTAALEHLIR